jgi:hypothetical protein
VMPLSMHYLKQQTAVEGLFPSMLTEFENNRGTP